MEIAQGIFAAIGFVAIGMGAILAVLTFFEKLQASNRRRKELEASVRAIERTVNSVESCVYRISASLPEKPTKGKNN